MDSKKNTTRDCELNMSDSSDVEDEEAPSGTVNESANSIGQTQDALDPNDIPREWPPMAKLTGKWKLNGPTLQCRVCLRSYTREYNMKIHARSQHTKPVYLCFGCSTERPQQQQQQRGGPWRICVGCKVVERKDSTPDFERDHSNCNLVYLDPLYCWYDDFERLRCHMQQMGNHGKPGTSDQHKFLVNVIDCPEAFT